MQAALLHLTQQTTAATCLSLYAELHQSFDLELHHAPLALPWCRMILVSKAHYYKAGVAFAFSVSAESMTLGHSFDQAYCCLQASIDSTSVSVNETFGACQSDAVPRWSPSTGDSGCKTGGTQS